MKIYIYSLKFPDGTLYIGQTNNYKTRWKGHSRSFHISKKLSIVDIAIRKFGWENVTPKILIICSSSIANFYEECAILKYKTINRKYGHNVLIGGMLQTTAMGRYMRSKQNRRPILRYSAETGFFEKWYPNLMWAAKDNNISTSRVCQSASIISPDKTVHKKIYMYENYSRKKRLNPLEYRPGRNHQYTWYVYDCLTKSISEPCFTLKEIGEITDSAERTIKNNIKKYIKENKKYKKRYFIYRALNTESLKTVELKILERIDNYIPPKKPIPPVWNKKSIKVIELSTNKTFEFDSCADAARKLKFKYKYVQRIVSRAQSKTGHYRGYSFNYI